MLDLGGGADLERAPALDVEGDPSAQIRQRTLSGRRDPGSGRLGTASGRESVTDRPAEGATLRTTGSGQAQRTAASRSLAGTASVQPPGRGSAPSRSAVVARPGAGVQAQVVMPHAGGRLLGEDSLHDGFGSDNGPALELDGSAGRIRRVEAPEDGEEPAAPLPIIETEEQKRERHIRELAGYGPAPEQVLMTPLYAARVMLRKRELQTELSAFSAQRKRADDAAQDALAKLGEAIYARRGEPAFSGLEKQLAAVYDAASRVDETQTEGNRRKQGTEQELTRLDAEIERAESQAAPLKRREAETLAVVESLRAQARKAELACRKLESEMEALQRAKAEVDPARWRVLTSERNARHGEFQSLGVQLRRVEDDLSVVRRELTQYMKTVAGLQDEKQWAGTALERAQQKQRVSEGSARSARQHALMSLANVARKQGLANGLDKQTSAVAETSERVVAKRQQEDLHRVAVESFDAGAYRKGIMILLGGSGFLLLSLTLMILL